MKRRWLQLTATITILGLSACAQQQREVARAPTPVTTPVPVSEDGYQELALMVDGVEIGALAKDPDRLHKAVVDLLQTDDPDPERIRAWLSTLRSRDAKWADVPASLRGLAGFSAAQLLEVYVASRASTYLEMTVRGRIRDYLFDEDQKTGHLSVETWVDYFDSEASFAAETPDRTERYHWDVDVVLRPEVEDSQGFVVVPRDDSQPTNPFPGTLEDLPQPMLDRIFNGEPGDPAASPPVPAKPPLLNKLWAKGKDIVVRNVYEIENDFSVVRLPNTDARYVSTDASCIDMMWAGPVPAVFTASSHPPNYCLGRCDRPLIVNTD